MDDRRIEWLDAARGIGILMVVLGHIVTLGGVAHNLIFGCHMPLFFLLSGYVYRPMPVRQTISRRFRSLMIPYFGFSLLGLAFTLAVPGMRGALNRGNAIYSLYTGSPAMVNNSSVWFLLSLFMVTVAMSAIMKIGRRGTRRGIVILCASAGLVFGMWSKKWDALPLNRLPLTLDCSLTALAFFALG